MMTTDAVHSEIPATGPRRFMLTFDDGPVPGKTDAVLATLSRYRGEDGQPVRAGFFMVGDAPIGFWAGRRYYAPYEIWIHKGSMRRHPEIVARVRSAGHLIGNHTTHHIWPRWPWFRAEARLKVELQAWETIAHEAAEQYPNPSPWNDQPRLFRTPYLADTPELTRVAQALGYQIIGGETVGDASPEHTVQDVLKRVLNLMESPKNDKAPVVLIFHDILPLTVNHLGDVIDCLLAQGYSLQHFDPDRLEDRTAGNRILENQPRIAASSITVA
jgi:peptidoglycan/xylan/chitin deacetylase (PgdA/CDA1 family)